jgi:hypothetical protein
MHPVHLFPVTTGTATSTAVFTTSTAVFTIVLIANVNVHGSIHNSPDSHSLLYVYVLRFRLWVLHRRLWVCL